MLSVGVDLASLPPDTGVCVIDWSEQPARVATLGRGRIGEQRLDDRALRDLMTQPGVGKVAIDAPFGWPEAFVEAVAMHAERGAWPIGLGGDHEGELLDRRRLERRVTDRWVTERTSADGRPVKQPLSVSTDMIAMPAMRCAALLAAAGQAEAGRVPLDGSGRYVEVYPDAALREWGLLPVDAANPRSGYKGATAEARRRRGLLVERLAEQVDGLLTLDTSERAACAAWDDVLDALVCALLARAAQLGRTVGPETDEQRRAALREGWIHLPERAPLRDALAP